jgi:hypothetical protein
MREATALEVAVGLLHLPSRVRTLRAGDLPSDLEILLRIVAGDERAIADALKSAGVPEQTVVAAASFYIEQVMLHPDADSYRALGVNPDASTDQLRRHMALLLRWLHPDREASGTRAAFVGRVTEAWNNVKTAERRADYDAARGGPVNGTPPAPPAQSEVVMSARSPTRGANGRSRQFGARTLRKRPTPRSIWHYLKHLISQDRR